MRMLADRHGKPSTVLDPCAGGGAFLRAARAVWPDVRTIGADIDPGAQGAAFATNGWKTCDACTLHAGPDDWVVTNPPFGPHVERGIAREIAAHFYETRPAVLALLLPLDYIGREEWFPLVSVSARVDPVRPRPFDVIRECVVVTWLGKYDAPKRGIRWSKK
jgi:hypothetical protein